MTALMVLLAALNATPIAATARSEQVAVFAGGCFWGIEAVYEHVKGVIRVTSGYAGGSVASPSYEDVSSGSTGHAESVQIVFDPAQVSYGTLMQIFFSVAHDPTQLNRQGPDDGTQYRSAIFYVNGDQKREAEAYVAQLTKAKTFSRPIVTQIAPLRTFYPAEDYHQDFAEKHPMHPYIVINDRPKVVQLKRQFPQLYREIEKSVATERGSK
jgi:peptide-methionine (S)-S-oxide reductase